MTPISLSSHLNTLKKCKETRVFYAFKNLSITRILWILSFQALDLLTSGKPGKDEVKSRISAEISWRYQSSSIFINVILCIYIYNMNKMLQLLKLRLWLLCFWLQLCLGCHRTCHSGGFECVESTHGCDTCPLSKDH